MRDTLEPREGLLLFRRIHLNKFKISCRLKHKLLAGQSQPEIELLVTIVRRMMEQTFKDRALLHLIEAKVKVLMLSCPKFLRKRISLVSSLKDSLL